MKNERIKVIKNGISRKGPIVYWMQRDQRVNDNWALIYAYKKAIETDEQLTVVFNIVDQFLGATFRQYHFMIEGLKEVEENLSKLNIQFILLTGKPENSISNFIKKNNCSFLITDFSPLKISRLWKNLVSSKIAIPFYEIDTHNVVPVWETSSKLEFAAYTIRPKINRLLPEFLDDFPKLKKMKNASSNLIKNDWEQIYKQLEVDKTVQHVKNFIPGENAAKKNFLSFLKKKLDKYSIHRNDPNKNGLSNISPYLHFGQISSQRIAKILIDFSAEDNSVASYLEELIIRKELADNYCYYNEDYDSFNGFYDWAKKTLNEHRNDKRDFIYSLDEFENANTHDNLWNAAQLEMVDTGKMHGFMRMYWAKKILEWTESPEQALEFGVYLNDKYELDGRDPNGYAGLAWSIGGVHDRAWGERPIFGKIRYMNFNGCKRKFDIRAYIQKYVKDEQTALFN